MNNVIRQLILIFILVGINGFFAMSEIALITVKKPKLKSLKNKGNQKAVRALKLLENSNQFLSTIQIGITFAGFLASASTAATLAKPLTNIVKQIPVPIITEYSHGITIFLSTAFISYLSLVLGELVPKQIALQWTERIALFVTVPIKYLGITASPLVKFLSLSTRIVLTIIPGADPDEKEDVVTEEDIRNMLHQTKRIEDEEKNLIEGVFTFGDTQVDEIMTPRTDIEYLKTDNTIQDMLELVNQTGFSRFPIIGNSLDDIKGIIHIRDIIVNLLDCNRDMKINKLIKRTYFVPESKMADNLLKELQSLNLHMAIIVNEYGGTVGLVTLENLIEEIVGDIKDEHDQEEGNIKKINEKHFIIKGNTDIGVINYRIGIEIPDTEEYETIAGFILNKLNHIPHPGENIEFGNWRIIVTDIKHNRIQRVKMVKKENN